MLPRSGRAPLTKKQELYYFQSVPRDILALTFASVGRSKTCSFAHATRTSHRVRPSRGSPLFRDADFEVKLSETDGPGRNVSSRPWSGREICITGVSGKQLQGDDAGADGLRQIDAYTDGKNWRVRTITPDGASKAHKETSC